MKVVALLAQKGGTGKSTLAVNLAVEAQRRANVALIDCDPQRSAADWSDLRRQLHGFDAPHCVPPECVQPVNMGKLADALDALRERAIDLVIIDTAPHGAPAAYAAATLADLVVIPTRPAAFDVHAIGETVKIIEEVEARAVFVLNAVPPRGPLGENARTALKAYGLSVCPAVVVQRAAFGYAVIDGRAVCEAAPRSKAAAEIRKLWNWIRRRL